MKPLLDIKRAMRLMVILLATCSCGGLAQVDPANHATNASSAFPSLNEIRQKWDRVEMEGVERAAAGGELTAQHYLAFCYSIGERVPKDGPKAVEWYERAGKAGYLPSLVNLGLLYQRGEVVPRDPGKALDYYRVSANAGLKQAQVNLGMLYRDGVGVPKDGVEAMKWFRLAAAQGHTTAMVEIGRAHRFGVGARKDSEEAIRWFEKAAHEGDSLAEMNLGLLYEEAGRMDLAHKFYRQAAGHGLAEAMWAMHNLYRNGLGVERDQKEATRWLHKSAEAGYARAQARLGYYHDYPDRETNRVGDTPASIAEAVKWYRRAAEQDWPYGQYQLADCYLEGRGVELNEEIGLKWMRAAADNGYLKAQVDLAELYARGIGEPRSPREQPMPLLQQVATTQSEDSAGSKQRAFQGIVLRHEHGIGTPRNLVASAEWYCRAALADVEGYSLKDKLNFTTSRRRAGWGGTGVPGYSLIMLIMPGGSGPGESLDRVLAVYLKSSAPNGGTNALEIAELFAKGRGAPLNRVSAWAWYNLAAVHGANEAVAKCRATEESLTPAEQAEARNEFDRLSKFLEEVRRECFSGRP